MNSDTSVISDGHYSMGGDSLKVPLKLFQENRERLCLKLREVTDSNIRNFVLLQGGSDQGICKGDSSDTVSVFRQESFFHWVFGVLEPDFFGGIEVSTGESHLFMPRLPEDYAIWMGKIKSKEDIKQRYLVDYVHYSDELEAFFGNMKDSPRDPKIIAPVTILTLSGVNTDSGLKTIEADFDWFAKFNTDKTTLHPIITECRVFKSELEMEVMRYAAKVSCDSHKNLMRQTKAGLREHQCESLFIHHSYFHGGCRNMGYTCICGTGPNGAVLHYGHAGAPNERTLRDGDMALFDMGAEYYRYTSDITVSFPVNGKFTDKQKVIYNAVLKANRAVLNKAKPGVSWVELHLLANRTVLEDLLQAGILQGKVDDMMEVNLVGRVFQPCGMGHFIGCDFHDVGGYLDGHPPRPEGRGLGSLRTARILQTGMVLTIEPGIYFNEYLLKEAFADENISKFLVKDQIELYRDFGGVRIEDEIIIHDDGAELISVLPRTVEEIEAWIAGK